MSTRRVQTAVHMIIRATCDMAVETLLIAIVADAGRAPSSHTRMLSQTFYEED
jgi:hypothetical protein